MLCFYLLRNSLNLHHHHHHVWEVRRRVEEVGGRARSTGLVSRIGRPAGGQPGELRRRAVHPSAAGAHRGQLLGPEEAAGEERPDLDGAVPGALGPRPAAGGPGPSVGTRLLSNRRRSAAADVCELCESRDELLRWDSLHRG